MNAAPDKTTENQAYYKSVIDEVRTLISYISELNYYIKNQTDRPHSIYELTSKDISFTSDYPINYMPDAKFIRTIIRNRKYRYNHFKENLFSDPIWDMLLELSLNFIEGKRTSINSLHLASGVPEATALRYIDILLNDELAERFFDPTDRRRKFIGLSSKGAKAMMQYFNEIDSFPHN